MAQLAGNEAVSPIGADSRRCTARQGSNAMNGSATAVASQTFFLMQGMDAVTSVKDTWVVANTPDPTGDQYLGSLTKPLRSVRISGRWVA